MHEKTADPEKGLLSFMTQPRLRVNRATTPGRGIDHDGRTLARGFQDGNLLWRSGLRGGLVDLVAGGVNQFIESRFELSAAKA